MMCKRLSSRVAFGRPIADQSIWLERIANCRVQIDSARLLVLNAGILEPEPLGRVEELIDFVTE